MRRVERTFCFTLDVLRFADHARLPTRRPLRADRRPADGHRQACPTASGRASATRRCSAPPAPARRPRWPGRSQEHQKPTLVLAHNKTLAAQLYAEFREFFPDNAVEYFVSYFDYYQPEAYLPRSDTYIEKDSSRNEEIDKLRHAATHALFERRDVIIVASVSCIYGLGAPVDYGATVLRLQVGGQYRRDARARATWSTSSTSATTAR